MSIFKKYVYKHIIENHSKKIPVILCQFLEINRNDSYSLFKKLDYSKAQYIIKPIT